MNPGCGWPPGVWESNSYGLPQQELENIPVPNPSPRVERHMGVASVSEAAALKAGGLELIVTKQKAPNATLAVARVA